jgi:hypothetical protein
MKYAGSVQSVHFLGPSDSFPAAPDPAPTSFQIRRHLGNLGSLLSLMFDEIRQKSTLSWPERTELALGSDEPECLDNTNSRSQK